jgi:uncharacterized protein (TIGR02246 family)
MEAEVLPARFSDAWNRHDMTALAELFEPDASFVNVVGMFWRSRGEIEQAHRATHETIFRNTQLSMLATQARILRCGCVAVHSHWRLSGQKAPDGSAAGAREGWLLFIAERSDSDWKIAVAQNTDIVPGIAAPPGSSPD